MSTFIVAMAGGVCVAALVGAAATFFRSSVGSIAEDRLDILAGTNQASIRDLAKKEQSVLSRPLDDVPTAIEEVISTFFNLRKLLDQADCAMSPGKFVTVAVCLGACGCVVALFCRLHWVLAIGMPLLIVPWPFVWLLFKRRKRMKQFTKQLPEALDLTARALRAGHSLGAGFQLVATEVPEPLGLEFGRVYEEQNLGIALDEALENLCERVPSLDLRFFATAVILQRTTGGDLAEILEKISHLIRERFKIFGQIQALTGEGRLSGTVLLAMPPVLMVVMMFMNYEYVMLLFTNPLGKKMLAVAGAMQLVGALVIKKIVNIKV
jgi:tight adherence protein B